MLNGETPVDNDPTPSSTDGSESDKTALPTENNSDKPSNEVVNVPPTTAPDARCAECEGQTVVSPFSDVQLCRDCRDGPHEYPWDTYDEDRNNDRERIAKYLSEHPAGASLPEIVRSIFVGYDEDGDPIAADGSDADYGFTRRFLNKYPELFKNETEKGSNYYTPTTRLLDLIIEGTTQTVDGGAYDEDFLQSVLATNTRVTQHGRELLRDGLQDYVNRINDYQMVFEVLNLRDGRSDYMLKDYKTRFNDIGRINKGYAKFNSALEHAGGSDSNAVFTTLTTDPSAHANLFEQITSINENFNQLKSRLEREVKDPTDDRPGEKLEYIKVLEFTEKGYPHLHVLFFDLPTNSAKDDMPWLLQKNRLSRWWSSCGQGRVVDAYPLTYSDDLGDDFAQDEGFVCWYRYGDNTLTDEEADERSRYGHDRIEINSGMTAGQYLGKYLSVMFAGIKDLATDGEFSGNIHDEKAATWKLGLYWATNRKMYSMSRNIEEAVKPDSNDRSAQTEFDRAVQAECSEAVSGAIDDVVASDMVTDIEWDDSDVSRATGCLLGLNNPTTQKEARDTYGKPKQYVINFIGTYHYWDLPAFVTHTTASYDSWERQRFDNDDDEVELSSSGDRPPPIDDDCVWDYVPSRAVGHPLEGQRA